MEIKNTLLVIPAYNEEQNISKVIQEVRKDLPGIEILIINDCSKDNTASLVQSLGVKCITMPFNVRYAMAIQTGIKYACLNGFQRVVQFDADGQHVASEVSKLITKMNEVNADIIIGSRFLEKTQYKHSFFRKMGTGLFTGLIRVFCKKNISDPTSGFQLLNRKVIERYSLMGGYPEFPDANLIIEMLDEGYEIAEVPVNMREREFGESMHGGIVKPIKYLVKVLYIIGIILLRRFFLERKGAQNV